MRYARVGFTLIALILASGIVAGLQPGAAGRDVGYVVAFEPGGSWIAANKDGARTLKPGDGLRDGDRLRPSDAKAAPEARLVAVLYTTGKATAFARGATVRGGTPNGKEWAILRALRSYVGKGTLEPAVVRSQPRLRDAVLMPDTPGQWKMLAPGLPAGNYNVQVRSLDRNGEPRGTLRPSIELTLGAGDAQPPSITASIQPGLWQVFVRPAQSNAPPELLWLYVTTSKADVDGSVRLSAMLDEARSLEGAPIETARSVLMRAFLLELASRERTR